MCNYTICFFQTYPYKNGISVECPGILPILWRESPCRAHNITRVSKPSHHTHTVRF